MLKFNRNTEERKTIAARLGELTGMQPFYTRAPRYAYEVGPYTIDRDGDLFVDEEQADADILTALMNEGLITGGEVVGDANEREPDTEPDGMQEAREIQDGAGESEEIEDPESTESDMTASDSISDEDASEESVSEEPQSDGPDTEETDHAAPEDPEDTDGDAAGEEPLDMNMNFEIPLGAHTGATLRNLVNLIYSRGPLVNQATGGHFEADTGLIEALKDDRCTYTRANFFRSVADYEDRHGKSLYGLTITPETVSFTGFGEAADVDHLRAFGHLAVMMNNQALHQKRIQAKAVDAANEKYAMRIWLVRIGMDGEEFKQTRKILMENLTGHSAFRTPAEAEKAKAKAQKKRDELRAAKEAARLAAEARETGSVADASPMEVQMIASGA
ncbi:MAG: hypothetical protein ACLTPC_07290 [Lacrimispora saccharolytica]